MNYQYVYILIAHDIGNKSDNIVEVFSEYVDALKLLSDLEYEDYEMLYRYRIENHRVV